jgi:hypothetical protein
MPRVWNPKMVELAKRSKDESLSVVDRMMALHTLGFMAQMGVPMIVDNSLEVEKPKYIWRNGAKVKVK